MCYIKLWKGSAFIKDFDLIHLLSIYINEDMISQMVIFGDKGHFDEIWNDYILMNLLSFMNY